MFVSVQTFDLLGVHLCIFSWCAYFSRCAFCTDGICPDVYYS